MWDENHSEAGCPCHQIWHSQRVEAADPVNGEDDDEGCWEFHQGRVEEIQVEVPTRGTHVHDEALVEHGAGEPEPREAESKASSMGEESEGPGRRTKDPMSWREACVPWFRMS